MIVGQLARTDHTADVAGDTRVRLGELYASLKQAVERHQKSFGITGSNVLLTQIRRRRYDFDLDHSRAPTT
jgi:hypothetical protein